jgi:hypothetical protein
MQSQVYQILINIIYTSAFSVEIKVYISKNRRTQMARVGFFNHAALAFHRNYHSNTADVRRNEIPKNIGEKLGDAMIWHVKSMPKHVCRCASDPRVITVAFTALAMLSVQFAFYPVATTLAVRAVATAALKLLPAETVKFAGYVLTELGVVGYGVRALGRFTNALLLADFYKDHGFELNANNDLVEIAS